MSEIDNACGRANPKGWFEGQRQLGLASVERKPPRGDAFIDIVIEGQRFRGRLLGNSLYVCSGSGACPLGRATLAVERPACLEWAIWDGDERAVDVFLSPEERRSLAVEFGLPIVADEDSELATATPADFFYASRAFVALQAWAEDHPRKVRVLRGDRFLGNWPRAALSHLQEDATAVDAARG